VDGVVHFTLFRYTFWTPFAQSSCLRTVPVTSRKKNARLSGLTLYAYHLLGG
jgi:hypothetical protein